MLSSKEARKGLLQSYARLVQGVYMLLRLFWFITELIDFVHGMLCGRRVVSFQLNN